MGENVSNISTNFWTLKSDYVRTTSFFRVVDNNVANVNKVSVFIKLFYTLRLVERESNVLKNTMNIAVFRNVSTAHAVCEDWTHTHTNYCAHRSGAEL